MKFTVEIECDNAAFCVCDGGEMSGEVARILREIAESLEYRGAAPCALRDSNGNAVGRAQFVES